MDYTIEWSPEATEDLDSIAENRKSNKINKIKGSGLLICLNERLRNQQL